MASAKDSSVKPLISIKRVTRGLTARQLATIQDVVQPNVSSFGIDREEAAPHA